MPIPVRIIPFLERGCPLTIYAGLARVSPGCPPDRGRLHTCYSPVRRSPAESASTSPAAPRLACVKPAASVHPEPGSNSPLLYLVFFFSCELSLRSGLQGIDFALFIIDVQVLKTLLLSVLWQYCHCTLFPRPSFFRSRPSFGGRFRRNANAKLLLL